MDEQGLPEGYRYELSPSPFLNHMGRLYYRRTRDAEDKEIVSATIRVADHHVNSWGLAHGSLMAGMAEVGCAGPAYIVDGPPVVIVDLSMQFIAAPKLGDWIEVHGWTTQRTRSLVFTQCRAEAGGKLVFTASSIQKIIGA